MWKGLPTEVDFPSSTATTLVDGLSIFALIVKEPEVGAPHARAPEVIKVPRFTPVATSVPLPTAVPPPTPVPVAYASTYDNTDNYTRAA